MSPSLIVLWALVGWCGTVPRPFPRPLPEPLPKPWPWPWPWCPVCTVIGVLAGIIGGWAYTQVFLPQDPVPMRSAIYAAATCVGAFAAARVATDIYGLLSSRQR